MAQSKRTRRLLWVVGSVALFLLLLPEGIRFGVQYGLEKFGAESATIEDVDLNLFVGTVAIEGVQVQYDGQETLALGLVEVDIDMLAIFSQRILLEQVALENIRFKAYQKDGHWIAAIPVPQSEEIQEKPEKVSEPSAWTFGLKTVLVDNAVIQATYNEDTHNLLLEELVADQLLMWQPDDNAQFKLKGSLNGAKMAFDGHLKPFAEAKTFELDLNLKRLNLSPVNAFLPETINHIAASLSLDTKVSVTLKPTGGIELQQNGVVALDLDSAELPEFKAQVGDIRWDGNVDVQIGKDKSPVVAADGTASLKDIDVDYQPMDVEALVQLVQWKGTVGLDVADINESIASDGLLDIQQLTVNDNSYSGSLVGFEKLRISSIGLQGLGNISVGEVALDKLQALSKQREMERAPALVSLNSFVVTDTQLKDQSAVSIQDIALSNLQGKLKRNSEGTIEVLDEWIASLQKRANNLEAEPIAGEEKAEAQSAEEEETHREFAFSVGKIEMLGENQFTFVDKGVTPEMEHPIKIEKLLIGEIDSKNRDQQAPVDINISLYEHGYLKVAGKATPLQIPDKMSADIKADIKGIELPKLSAYIEPAVGYRANSGQLNVASKAFIDKGKLDSETTVKVLRVDFEAVDEELIAKLNKNLTMPIDTALSIITDSDDTLEIDVPVKGDLANPDIKINTIIAGAVTQAVQNAAMTYFKYAVQPFGAIMMVSETIGDMSLQAKFEDVRFMPGLAQIVEEQNGYLEKVAAMVKEKENFSVLVCVVVTDQDFKARKPVLVLAEGQKYDWDEPAKLLAKERSGYIKEQLIKTYGLGPDRVQTCQPQLGEGVPHAVMGI